MVSPLLALMRDQVRLTQLSEILRMLSEMCMNDRFGSRSVNVSDLVQVPMKEHSRLQPNPFSS